MSNNDLNINLNVQGDETFDPGQSFGETAQDKNFTDLTGGDGAFRPDFFKSAPEFLNLMSILADTHTAIRHVFLPLRKLFQILANRSQGQAGVAQLANRNQQFFVVPPKEEKPDKRKKKNDAAAEPFFPKAAFFPPEPPKPDSFFPKSRSEPPPTPTPESVPKLSEFAKQVITGQFKRAGESAHSIFKSKLEFASKFVQQNFAKVAGVAAGVATGLVAVGVAAATFRFGINKINSFTKSIEDVSADVASARALAEVRELQASQRAANQSGSAAGEVIEAQSGLRIELQKLSSLFTRVFGPVITGILKIVTSIMALFSNALEIFAPILEFISFIVKLGLSGISILVDILNAVLAPLRFISDTAKDVKKFLSGLAGVDTELEALAPILGIFGDNTKDFAKRARNTKLKPPITFPSGR